MGFLPPPDAPDAAPLPYRNDDGITFGYLHRLYKIFDATKALWAHILYDVETAYREMWQRWCAGEPTAALTVTHDVQAAVRPRVA